MHGLDAVIQHGPQVIRCKAYVSAGIIDDAILQSYLGRYELVPGFVITVSKEGSQMKAQATGQPQFEIYPKAENVFYLKVVVAQITFNKNEEGQVESLTLYQGGQETVGKKLED